MAAEGKEPGGILCTITSWKAALLGPYVDFTGLGVILPLIPFYLQDLGVDEVFIGLVLSAQYTGVVIGAIFWGRLSDYFGVRRIYILLLVLDAVLFFLSAIVEDHVQLIIIRGLAGFCAIMPLGTAWVSATAPPEKQMQAFTLLFVSIIGGFISGSAIGGLLGSVKTGIGVGDGGWFAAVSTSTVLVVIVLLIILLGTAPPPARDPNTVQPKPEGVKAATNNVEFLACVVVGFLGANEGGVVGVLMSTLMTTPAPDGFGYSEAAMGGIFVVIASNLLISSLVFATWLGKRTLAQQRVVLLGMATMTMSCLIMAVMIAWEAGGLWDGGDWVFLGLLLILFCFQCVVGPTSMEIASLIAASKAKNANGTIMGMQQMAMNLGQAVGPIIGASLYKLNLWMPWLYLVAFEFLVLGLNIYVWRKKCGPQTPEAERITRSLFDISVIAPPEEPADESKDTAAAGDDGDAAVTAVEDVAVKVEDADADRTAELAKLREEKAAAALAAAGDGGGGKSHQP